MKFEKNYEVRFFNGISGALSCRRIRAYSTEDIYRYMKQFGHRIIEIKEVGQ